MIQYGKEHFCICKIHDVTHVFLHLEKMCRPGSLSSHPWVLLPAMRYTSIVQLLVRYIYIEHLLSGMGLDGTTPFTPTLSSLHGESTEKTWCETFLSAAISIKSGYHTEHQYIQPCEENVCYLYAYFPCIVRGKHVLCLESKQKF